MFKLKHLAVALAAICSAQMACAVEFAQGMSPSTASLQEAALDAHAGAAQAPAVHQAASAQKQAKDWLAKLGMIEGETDSTVIQIGVYTQKATARTISTVRNVGTMAAILDAKAKIIRFLQTSASAEIMNTMPTNDAFGTEYDRQKAELEKQIEDLMSEYELALSEIDQEKSKQAAGITYDEVLKDGLVSCLKKHDIEIDPDDFSGKAASRIAELQKTADSIDKRLDELVKLQQELKGRLNNEQSSTIEILSSMVLTGAVVVNSYESLIDNQYEVAVVVSWSAPQERFIRSLLGIEGDFKPFKPTTKKSRADYINKTRWERVAGGRWIVSNDGVPRLYAVGTAELRNNQSSTKTAARALADTNALGNLALALQSDVAARQSARAKVQNLQDGKGGEDVQTANEVAQELVAKVKNLQIQGASRVFEDLRTSPLTGKPTYVCVYEYSPVGKKLAKKLFDQQRDTAVEMGKDQQRTRGYYEESMNQIQDARTSEAAYEEGRAQATESAARGAAAQGAAGSSASSAGSASQDGSLRNSSFGGEGEEDFTF